MPKVDHHEVKKEVHQESKEAKHHEEPKEVIHHEIK
jgi:hypothetical protein